MKEASYVNFFCVGYFILAIQLNCSWSLNYVVKIVGTLFLLGGMWEMKSYNDKFSKPQNLAILVLMLNVLAAVLFALLKAFGLSITARNITGLCVGVITVLMLIALQKRILDIICTDSDIVNDLSGLVRLKSVWQTLVYFTLAGLVFNLLNIIPNDTVSDTAGLLMAICRIIMYVISIVMLYRFNKVRVDHYRKNNQIVYKGE